MKKKLYKDRSDQKLCGVCSGLAKYFNLDPTVVRLVMVLLSLSGGSGVLFYIICALVIPDEPDYIEE